MSITRRQFIHMMGLAGVAGMLPGCGLVADRKRPSDPYEIPKYGNVSLLHITDTHAQLMPIYFREPNVNIGVGKAWGRVPHLVGEHLLKHFDIPAHSRDAYAFTYLDFVKAARKYGKVGGFAHLATLVKRVRAERGDGNSLLLDGGDSWQGSATALWSRGQDMVGADNLLGVEAMTGHWEFTYKDSEVLKNIGKFKGEFLAQNVMVRPEDSFDYPFSDFPGYDADSGHAFKPYSIHEVGGAKVLVIGQAFPYTPIANPQRFMPDWSFGIHDQQMQQIIDTVRAHEKPDLVVVLSHNGMDVDLKMARKVSGIDVILGGHTHDGVPQPSVVKNRSGQTLVCNAGSNGKFLGVLDMDVRGGKVHGYRYRLAPIFSNLLEPDPEMATYVEKVRKPYLEKLNEPLATADLLLYRRGNFNGTFDQVICDAQRAVGDAQISLSPGFRWGTTVMPGETITMERVMDQTGITYPETYVREISGAQLKGILEDVCDNLFNRNPYLQQGGDMVRVGGMDYVCDPTADMGSRISDMRLDDGTPVEAHRKYKVAGWATVSSKAPGRPIWDIVAEYLRDQKVARVTKLNTPRLKNVAGNPGVADYPPSI